MADRAGMTRHASIESRGCLVRNPPYLESNQQLVENLVCFEILLVKYCFNKIYWESAPRLFLQHVLDHVHIVRCHWVVPGGWSWWLCHRVRLCMFGDAHVWVWGGRAIPAFHLSKFSSTLICSIFCSKLIHGNTLVVTVNCGLGGYVEFDEKSNHENIHLSHAENGDCYRHNLFWFIFSLWHYIPPTDRICFGESFSVSGFTWLSKHGRIIYE